MTRCFMTIPEAVQLVLQAAALGKQGVVFVLDMGEPVRIADLAMDLIRLSGLEPNTDIGVEFTSVRPGEKLYKELSSRVLTSSRRSTQRSCVRAMSRRMAAKRATSRDSLPPRGTNGPRARSAA